MQEFAVNLFAAVIIAVMLVAFVQGMARAWGWRLGPQENTVVTVVSLVVAGLFILH